MAGTGENGSSMYQLDSPRDIFIHKPTNQLYVADTNNKRIQIFSLDRLNNKGTTVASTKGSPYKIYVDDDVHGPTIYVALPDSHRIEKWIQGTTLGMQVGKKCVDCKCVSVDSEKNVYMIDRKGECILKWSPITNKTTFFAGVPKCDGINGNYRLYEIGDIYFDKNTDSIYVADTRSYQIVKWRSGSQGGIIIVGSSLSVPEGVLIDDETHVIYVADSSNNRIRMWTPNAFGGVNIVGGRYLHHAPFTYRKEKKQIKPEIPDLLIYAVFIVQ